MLLVANVVGRCWSVVVSWSVLVMVGDGWCWLVGVGWLPVDLCTEGAAGGSLLDPKVTERVMQRLRDGGPEEPEELRSLSAQERRILELVAEGLTNKQIGERLFLAEKTVKNYMSNVLAKLGLVSRTQAAVFATRLMT